jgi:hypothetical protein
MSMRNVLVFPSGDEQDFMYPPDREVIEGTELEVVMMDESTHRLKVTSIVREEKRILYHLSY